MPTFTLPYEVLSRSPSVWRAPTNHEIRQLIGKDSFSGITIAEAAQLVGVTPQNFRKYLARDGASTRQKMSYAMWHLLLHRLNIQH